MGLWQEIYAQLNDGEGATARDAFALCYTVWSGKGGYFQNVKSLGSFSKEEVVLYANRGSIRITGENFTVAKYLEHDVLIRGNIRSITREDA